MFQSPIIEGLMVHLSLLEHLFKHLHTLMLEPIDIYKCGFQLQFSTYFKYDVIALYAGTGIVYLAQTTNRQFNE